MTPNNSVERTPRMLRGALLRSPPLTSNVKQKMKNKTSYEKEAEKITKALLEVMGLNFDASFLQKTDLLAMTSFSPLADLLRNKRTEMNGNFKAFCKSNGFP